MCGVAQPRSADMLKDEVLNSIEDASKDEVKGLKTHIELHAININNALVDDILLWVRIVRLFKSRVRNSTCQGMKTYLTQE